jgi:hypothetical protein
VIGRCKIVLGWYWLSLSGGASVGPRLLLGTLLVKNDKTVKFDISSEYFNIIEVLVVV